MGPLCPGDVVGSGNTASSPASGPFCCALGRRAVLQNSHFGKDSPQAPPTADRRQPLTAIHHPDNDGCLVFIGADLWWEEDEEGKADSPQGCILGEGATPLPSEGTQCGRVSIWTPKDWGC